MANTEVEAPAANVQNNSEEKNNKPYKSCWRRIHSVVTIEPVLFLYAVSSMSYLAALPQYVYAELEKQQGPSDNSTTSDTSGQAQSQASDFMLLVSVASLPPAALITMFLGRYSDGRGRRLALIPPLLGSILRSLITLAVVHWQWNLYVLLLAAFLESISGGIMAMFMACFAYISDISSTKSRALRIIIVEGILALGIATAMLTAGYIIRIYGYEYAFLFSLSVQAVNTPLMLFYIEETITHTENIKLFSLTHVLETIRLFTRDPGNGRQWKLVTIMLVLVLVFMVAVGSGDITTLFLLDNPLCFNSVQLGYYQGSVYVIKAIWGMVLVKLLYHWLQDAGLMILGCVAGIAGQIVLAFSYNWIMVFTVPVILANSSPIIALCRAFSSKLVHPKEMGTLFAAIAFGEQVSNLLGRIIFNLIYSKTVAIFAGIAFLVGAGVYFVALLMAVGLHVGVKRQTVPENTETYETIN